MKIEKQQIGDLNKKSIIAHKAQFNFLAGQLTHLGIKSQQLIERLKAFQVAIPSWALGAGGTRFGRFSYGGEPSTLEQKIDDIGVLHALTQSAGAVSLHIPWDTPEDYEAIKQKAALHNIGFDAVNSNTFQDQPDARQSYRFGSLSNVDQHVREQAIHHNIEVIRIGKKLGSKSLTVWLADGSNFPGQHNFQTALQYTQTSLKIIYDSLPKDWKLYIEYKPYEPNFYSTVIQDWGTSFMLAKECGARAYTLVDLGHHLPNTNIEQIVATLLHKGMLGGFHFNDSKYGDDDLTVGSIKPYTLFLIFNELVYGMAKNPQNPEIAWMIDASHNIKDPLEDLIQSLEAILIAYAQALLIDQQKLRAAQEAQDVALCQEILQTAYRTDVRPLVKESRLQLHGALDPLSAYRSLGIRQALINERGKDARASGL